MTNLSNKDNRKKVFDSNIFIEKQKEQKAKEKENTFFNVMNTVAFTDFYKSNNTRDTRVHTGATGKKELIISPESNNKLRIVVGEYDEKWEVIPIHTKQTLRVLQKYLSENKQRHIVIPLSEFMSRRGLSHEGRARKEISEDLRTLQHLEVNFDLLDRNKKVIDTLHVNVLGARGDIKDNYVRATFSEDFLTFLIAGLSREDGTVFLTQKGTALDRMNCGQSTLPYTIGELIEEAWSHQRYDKYNGYKIREYAIISIRHLLSKCKELKTRDEIIEEAKAKGVKPRVSQFIIKPVENALEKLVDAGHMSEWTYCHAKGVEPTDKVIDYSNTELEPQEEEFEEVDKGKSYANYDVWENLYIKIPFPDNYVIEDHDKKKTVKYKTDKKEKRRKSKK